MRQKALYIVVILLTIGATWLVLELKSNIDERKMEGGKGPEIKGVLEQGRWTVEIKRQLDPNQVGDLPLALDQVYNIGFAIHDDYSNSRFHHVSLGYRLGFDKEEEGIEINVVKQ